MSDWIRELGELLAEAGATPYIRKHGAVPGTCEHGVKMADVCRECIPRRRERAPEKP